MSYWFEYDAELARKVQYEEAHEEGFAEGFIEGFIEGFVEGFVEGREEKALEMVKNLLMAQTPIKYIVAATGWSEEKILKLAEGN